MTVLVKNREVDLPVYQSLVKAKVNKLLAKLLASRGAQGYADYELSISNLLPYQALFNCEKMAAELLQAIKTNKKLLIVSDYDADGATACVVGYTALKAFGANVEYLIPKRLVQGYGLTVDIAEIACSNKYSPDYIITVDNGISSFDGIDYCNSRGVKVLVTDHHQAGSSLPNAHLIVNPNQPACSFKSKALAGVGVIYYVMLALEKLISEDDLIKKQPHFSVDSLLPIVTIGTIADVVSLDFNNRLLVKAGMERIWKGKCSEGVKALIRCANKRINALTSSDIAFQIGPRINAVGRLGTMDIGVECLICENPGKAMDLAKELQSTNETRKDVEAEVIEDAVATAKIDESKFTVVLGSETWHQGVVGIVAGRIKEKYWRPTFVFTKMECADGEMKGSGRSIPGLNVRDALDEVNRTFPGILLKFGGHAMAAGATIKSDKFDEFNEAFEKVVSKYLTPDQLHQVVETDGRVPALYLNTGSILHIKEFPWGQNFPEPIFKDEFEIKAQKLIGGGKHLKLDICKDGVVYSAVMFRQESLIPSSVATFVYKLDINEYMGNTSVQLLIDRVLDT